jgi:hypothetical protein
MSRDLDKEISVGISIVSALKSTSGNGTGVDLLGFTKVAAVSVAGAITDGTHALKLQDSDDNATWADVDAEYLSGAFTNLTSSAGGSAAQEVGYLGSKRYLRAVATVTGSPSTGGIYGVVIVRSGARRLPQ